MDNYYLLIFLAFIGFLALAAILLVPIYRFLKREEKAGEQWTQHILAQRLQKPTSSPNGSIPSNNDTEENQPS